MRLMIACYALGKEDWFVKYAAWIFAGVLFASGAAWANEQSPLSIERRRDQFGKDFGYFIYPLASKIPGLGTAEGAGATVLNIAGTDTNFTGFKLVGGFEASGCARL